MDRLASRIGLGGSDWRIVGHCDRATRVGAPMIFGMKGATLLIQEGRSSIIADTPQECTNCHRMTYFFENRAGRTSCTACVAERSGDEPVLPR